MRYDLNSMLPEQAFRPVARKMTLEGGDSPPPPDYAPMAQATIRAQELANAQSDKQMVWADKQYEETKAANAPILALQKSGLEQQQQQAKDYYDYNVNTFRPLEKGIVAGAENFSTADYANGLATKASADVGDAAANMNAQRERSMRGMGVDPSSAKFQGLAKQQDNAVAAARAGAMTGARQTAEQLGWAKRLDAAGLGRGLAGASTAAYSGANTSGNSFVGNNAVAGNQYTAGLNSSVNTSLAGAKFGMDGAGAILSADTSRYNTDMNNYSSPTDIAMGLVGAGASAVGSFYGAGGGAKKT